MVSLWSVLCGEWPRENKSIVRVNLSRTGWHDQSCDALDLMIGRNKHIQELDLDQLDVSGEDVLASISSALAHNSELKRLSFRENDIGEFAVRILSKALVIHPSLQHLDLSNCRFAGSTGVLSLAEGLGKNRSLTTISLEACKLGDEGTVSIARAIQLNRTLQSIDLCDNGIGLEGLTTLVNGMEQNDMLQSVYLQGNDVCDEGALLLRSLLRESDVYRLQGHRFANRTSILWSHQLCRTQVHWECEGRPVSLAANPRAC